MLLTSPHALGPHETTLGRTLAARAARHPDRTFLIEPGAGEVRRIDFGAMYVSARRSAAALVAADVGTLAIIAPNSIAHATLSLAAALVGIPILPLAPIHLTGEDHRRIALLERIATHAVTTDDAVTAALAERAPRVKRLDTPMLLAGQPVPRAVETRMQAVSGATVAKYLVTSGTTNGPRAVLTTHAMLLGNQAALAVHWPIVTRAPRLVDHLPWSHAYGGNKIFNLTLVAGGTLVIDDGSPSAAGSARMIENISTFAPTVYFDVPRGYRVLIEALERDPAFAQRFFSRLTLAGNGGAPLPLALAQRWNRAAARAGSDVGIFSAWGMTETTPMAIAPRTNADPRSIGTPIPGMDVLLVPLGGDEFEAHVRGRHVTAGYEPPRSDAFRPDGFLRTGDAMQWLDPGNPERGLRFCGRIDERVKTSAGVWVDGERLNDEITTALDPWSAAVLFAPIDDAVGVVLIPTGDDRIDPATVVARLGHLASAARPSSQRVIRAIVCDIPLAPNETTAKGSLNARTIRAHRADDFTALTGHPADARVVLLG